MLLLLSPAAFSASCRSPIVVPQPTSCLRRVSYALPWALPLQLWSSGQACSPCRCGAFVSYGSSTRGGACKRGAPPPPPPRDWRSGRLSSRRRRTPAALPSNWLWAPSACAELPAEPLGSAGSFFCVQGAGERSCRDHERNECPAEPWIREKKSRVTIGLTELRTHGGRPRARKGVCIRAFSLDWLSGRDLGL